MSSYWELLFIISIISLGVLFIFGGTMCGYWWAYRYFYSIDTFERCDHCVDVEGTDETCAVFLYIVIRVLILAIFYVTVRLVIFGWETPVLYIQIGQPRRHQNMHRGSLNRDHPTGG
jgi:hypothetical protein